MERHARQAELGTARQIAGWALLAVGLAASLALAMHALTGKSFPHCGPEQGCDEALASRWSNIGGWPVAYAALCYFAGTSLAWLTARRQGVSLFLRWVVRLAALVSVAYLLLGWHLNIRCWYCLAVQAANLSFWLLVETSPKSRESLRSAMAFVGAFAVLFAAITVTESERRWREGETAQEQHDRTADSSPISAEVTVYTDYSCPICADVDDELSEVMQTNPDLLVTVKHYPLSTECNPHIATTLHPNACQAARVSMAARTVSDNDAAFWRTHYWLFERNGNFTTDELREALPELGFDDSEAFLQAVGSDEVKRRIQIGLSDAKARGVDGTPTLFVNGALLRNWKENALEAAIRSAASRKSARSTRTDPADR